MSDEPVDGLAEGEFPDGASPDKELPDKELSDCELDEGASTDDPLVARIRTGDTEALADYLQLNRVQIIAFLVAITSEHLRRVVDAEDLFQEVSTCALTGLPTAPLDTYSPLQWLRQIARRRVIDAHRFHFGAKRRDVGRQRSMHESGAAGGGGGLEAMIVSSMTSPTAALSRDIRVSRMQEAIAALPEEQRTVIAMRYLEGLSTKRIAESLGKSDVAIRVLLSRTVRVLEQQLNDVRPSPRS